MPNLTKLDHETVDADTFSGWGADMVKCKLELSSPVRMH